MKRVAAVFILLFCVTMSSSFAFSGVGDVQEKRFYLAENTADKKVEAKDLYYKGMKLRIADKQFQKAIDTFTRSIELDPTYLPPYYERADLYKKTEHWEEALQDYNRILELDPYSRTAYFNRGNAYSKLGDQEKAVENFKIAAEMGYLPAESVLKSEGGHPKQESGH